MTTKLAKPVAVNAPPLPVPSKGQGLQRHHVDRSLEPDLTFGVLRRTYLELVNDALVFGWTKLHPIRPMSDPERPEFRVWQPTAARHEVLLPRSASDLLCHPQALLETFERQPRTDRKDLAVVLKLKLGVTDALHPGWERARGFARSLFVIEHGLPVLLVLHVPSQSGSRTPAPPHIHVMALAQVLGPHGFGGFCTIARDDAHAGIAAAWRASA